MDTWINGYTSPQLDSSQDLSNITGNTVDGLTTLSFMRKRSTGDSKVIYYYVLNSCGMEIFKINSSSLIQSKLTEWFLLNKFLILNSGYICLQDMTFSDDKCLYLTFIVKGGAYNPVNKKLKKHEQVPMFSNDRVCIRSCGAGKSLKSIIT